MEYKRLTTTQVVNGRNIKTVTSKGKVTIQDLIDRLWELEDKIEAGTLIELPCKVGDAAYTCYGNYIQEWKVARIDILGWDILFRLGNDGTDDYNAEYLSGVGDRLFFDKAAAEKKLEELKNEK